MILLDTNYLVRVLVPASAEAEQVRAWLRQGETLCTAAVCWYEFLCGPVTPEAVAVVEGLLRGGVLPFDQAASAEAARLWNQSGRARQLRVDAMVAATAGVLGAERLGAFFRDAPRAELDVGRSRELGRPVGFE